MECVYIFIWKSEFIRSYSTRTGARRTFRSDTFLYMRFFKMPAYLRGPHFGKRFFYLSFVYILLIRGRPFPIQPAPESGI